MKNNNLVVKDNALIRSSYHLNLVEQRVVLLAIVSARNSNVSITTDTEFEIYANEYANAFNCSLNTAYEALKKASKTLFERQFSYQEYRKGKLGEFTSRWIQKAGYIKEDACILIKLSSDIIPLVTELEKNFTSYNLLQIRGLNSSYAVRLYELIISWKGVNNYTINLCDLRKILQLSNEYERVYNLKQRVIEPSLHQINKNTDIKVKYQQIKKGRKITAFRFSFFMKNQIKHLEIEQWIELNNLARTGEKWEEAKSRLYRKYQEYLNV